MKYGHIEKDTNKLLGWYSDKIHGEYIPPVYATNEEKEQILIKEGYYDISTIPTPNIEVTDEQWQEAINVNANYYDDFAKEFKNKDFRTTDEIEKQNVLMINVKANQLIEEKYPIYKQLNITNLLTPYTEADRDNMKIFIENIREISNAAIDNGTLLDDINWG